MSAIFDVKLLKIRGFDMTMRMAIRDDQEYYQGNILEPTLNSSIMGNGGLFMSLNLSPTIVLTSIKRGNTGVFLKRSIKLKYEDFVLVKNKLNYFTKYVKEIENRAVKTKKHFVEYKKSTGILINEKKAEVRKIKNKEEFEKAKEDLDIFVKEENRKLEELMTDINNLNTKLGRAEMECVLYPDPLSRDRKNIIKFESAVIVDRRDRLNDTNISGFSIWIEDVESELEKNELYALADLMDKMDLMSLAQQAYTNYLLGNITNKKLKETKKDTGYKQKQHVLQQEVETGKKKKIGFMNKGREIRPGLSMMKSQKSQSVVDDSFDQLANMG